MHFLINLYRALHRPDPSVWQSKAASENDRVRRRLGWRRTPVVTYDPDSAEERVRAVELNSATLRATAAQVKEVSVAEQRRLHRVRAWETARQGLPAPVEQAVREPRVVIVRPSREVEIKTEP